MTSEVDPRVIQTLLFCCVVLSAMCCVVWVSMATLARISIRASWALAAANACTGVSVALHGLRGVLPDAYTYWPCDVLAVASFAWARAAIPALAARPLAGRLGVPLLLGAALVLALLSYSDDLRWQARIVNLCGGVLALAAAMDARRLVHEIAPTLRRARYLSLPLFLIAALMLLRAVESFVYPGRSQDLRLPTGFNAVFLASALALSLVQNTAMGFLALMRLIQRIRQLTETDTLTGVFNRLAFEQRLGQAHAGVRRGEPYALVLIDMDRFKKLNDSLGHAAGDAALRALVATLRPCLREVDSLGRWGGEEFAVLLPLTDLAGALLLADRMRALVQACTFEWLGKPWPLSASFGIAEGRASDATAEQVVARADQGLYRAKAQGRNLVQAVE